MTRRKSEHWAYEKEVRLLVPWDFRRVRLLEEGVKMRLLSIPPTAILRVVLGCMSEQQIIDETKAVLSEKRFAHVRLEHMRRDLHKYQLHAVPISPQ